VGYLKILSLRKGIEKLCWKKLKCNSKCVSGDYITWINNDTTTEKEKHEATEYSINICSKGIELWLWQCPMSNITSQLDTNLHPHPQTDMYNTTEPRFNKCHN